MDTIAASSRVINDPHDKWSENFQLAPPFDAESFQKKLNNIAGLTQAGEPVLRLTWGGNESVYVVEDGYLVETPRYAFPKGRGKIIPIRRWFIEENTDPGQLEAMGGKNYDKLHVKEKGFYDRWLLIADHGKCPPKCQDKKMCYGDYRHPNESDLDYVAEVTFQLNADKLRPDPRKPVTHEMAASYLPKEPDEAEKEAKDEQENADFMKDWMRTHSVGRTQNTKPS